MSRSFAATARKSSSWPRESALTFSRLSPVRTVSGALRPRPAPTLSAGCVVTSSWLSASVNAAESAARISLTEFFPSPVARFAESKAMTWPRVIEVSGAVPRVGRMWRRNVAVYDSNVRFAISDLMVTSHFSTYSASVTAGASTGLASASFSSSALRASIAACASSYLAA